MIAKSESMMKNVFDFSKTKFKSSFARFLFAQDFEILLLNIVRRNIFQNETLSRAYCSTAVHIVLINFLDFVL